MKRPPRGSDRRPNEHDVLAYMTFNEGLRAKLHGTNPLERLDTEIKRRTDVAGMLPNPEALIRRVVAFSTGLEPVATSWLTARTE